MMVVQIYRGSRNAVCVTTRRFSRNVLYFVVTVHRERQGMNHEDRRHIKKIENQSLASSCLNDLVVWFPGFNKGPR